MERRRGSWSILEAFVERVRNEIAVREAYDPIKAKEEARARFEVAKVRMHEIGAVNLMGAIAPLLPGTTLTVTEDYDRAGGRGFPPSVTLKAPERSIDPRTIEIDTLSVYPLVFQPSMICVTIWRQRSEKTQDGQIKLFGHRRWDRDASMNSTRHLLPKAILEGVKQLGLPNINLKNVENALGLTATSSTPKRS